MVQIRTMDSFFSNYKSTILLTEKQKALFVEFQSKHNEPNFVFNSYIDNENHLKTFDKIRNDFLEVILYVIFPFCSHLKITGSLFYVDVATHEICKVTIKDSKIYSCFSSTSNGVQEWTTPTEATAPPTYEQVLTSHDEIIATLDTDKPGWCIRIWTTHKPFTDIEQDVKVSLEQSPVINFQENKVELGRIPLTFNLSDLIKVKGKIKIQKPTSEIESFFKNPNFFKDNPKLEFLKEVFPKAWKDAQDIMKRINSVSGKNEI